MSLPATEDHQDATAMTSKDIINRLSDLSREEGLFTKQIDGIFFWKLVIFDLHRTLLKQYNFIEESVGVSRPSKFSRLGSLVKNHYRHSTFRRKEPVATLILESSRKVRSNGTYYDPYTWHHHGLFGDNYELIDQGFRGYHYEKPDKNRTYAEEIYYDSLYPRYLKLFKSSFSKTDLEYVNFLESRINEDFGTKVDLAGLIQAQLRRFKCQYVKYGKLFSLKRPEKLYLVCSYGKEGIIHAAREKGITVHEFQHGIMSSYHPGYSFPTGMQIPYFPDKLLLFGEYWAESTNLPVDPGNIQFIGFPDLDQKLNQLSATRKNNKKVVFISQWTVSSFIFEKSLETAKANPDYAILLRLHPAETHGSIQVYTRSITESGVDNLTIRDGNNSIHEDLSDASFAVGICSTGIFEALAFKCTVILLDGSGIENMEYLIESSYVHKVSASAIIDFKSLPALRRMERSYIFKEYTPCSKG